MNTKAAHMTASELFDRSVEADELADSYELTGNHGTAQIFRNQAAEFRAACDAATPSTSTGFAA